MPGFTFTDEDLSRNNPLEATWYPLKVVSVTSGPGKKDSSSTTWTIDMVVSSGPGAKTPVRHYLSDKMPSSAIQYIRSFIPDGKVVAGKEYPIEATHGKETMGYCTWDADFKTNKALDFKPIGK